MKIVVFKQREKVKGYASSDLKGLRKEMGRLTQDLSRMSSSLFRLRKKVMYCCR